MSVDLISLATAVSSVVGGALSGVNVRVMDQVVTMEEFPQVNIQMPSFTILDDGETIGLSTTFFVRYAVPIICFEDGEDRLATQTAVASLVRSVSNALRTHGNRTLNDFPSVTATYLTGGNSLDADDRDRMGILSAYELTLEIETQETA